MKRYHYGRPDVDPAAGERAAHVATDAPEEMIERLRSLIFRTFYAGQDGRRWLQDQRPLLMVLTWPAVWCNDRGIGIPASEYEAKMREIIETIARHGDVKAVRLVPAYLGDCVRKHFAHHGEELYESRKHVRNALDLAFLKGGDTVGGARAGAGADVVPALLQAHAVLATAKVRARAKPASGDSSQGLLFGV